MHMHTHAQRHTQHMHMINLEHFINSTIVTAQEATGLQVMSLIKVVGSDS